MIKKLTVPVVAWAAILVAGAVEGQDVFNDLLHERIDEHRLRHDYRVMHRDLARGNTAAAQVDMQRIQQDRAVLARDLAQLNYDRNGGGPIAPNPNFAANNPVVGGRGYLNPSQPMQPAFPPLPPPMAQPTLPPLSSSIMPPMNPLPSGVGLVRPNPLPGVPQTIWISNPASTGVTLNYVLGGQAYSIESGRIQEFTVTAPTMIAFNRGGQGGVASYTLTGGNSFEFQSDGSGWFVATKRPVFAELPQNPLPPSPALNLAPAPVPAPVPDAATSSLPPLSSIISQP